MGKKNVGITLGIIILLIIVGGIIYFMQGTSQTAIPTGAENLNCSNYDGCIDYLKSQGMPDNFLENNNIKITCENGVCYATK